MSFAHLLPNSSSSSSSRKGSGPIWIFLNLIRLLSMVSILLVIASTIVLMVSDFKAVNAWIKAGSPSSGLSDGSEDADDWECDVIQNSTIPNQVGGPFYSISSRLFILLVSIVLFLSEMGGPRFVRRCFELFLPPLGPAHGLAILGFIECFVATTTLSHFVPLFSVISCWFLFVLGCFNILLGYFGPSLKTTRQIFAFEAPTPTIPAPSSLSSSYDEEKSYSSNFNFNSSSAPARPARESKYKFFPNADRDANRSLEDGRKFVSFGGQAESGGKVKIGSGGGMKPVGWGGFGKKAEGEAKLKGYLISKPLNVTPKA